MIHPSRTGRPTHPILRCRHLTATATLAAIFAAFPSHADILSQYTFGPDGTTPSILDPTTVALNATGTAIVGGSGNTLDVSNSQGPAPVSAPWLRVVPTGAWTNPDAAVAANAYFEFSLIANGGFLLDLASLAFDVMRGGGSTPRGYDVRTSIDNFSTTVGTAAAGTQRPTFTNVTIDLAAPAFQDLNTITFRIYSYSPGSGASIEYDNITINGILQALNFDGYTWTGAINNLWNTSTANWSGPGTVYVDATPASNVRFDDSASLTNVTIEGLSLNPNSVLFENTVPYSILGGDLNITTSLIKDGSGATTLDNSTTAANVTIANGLLALSPEATLSAPSIIVSATGTLSTEVGSTLFATSAVQVGGNLVLKAAAQTLAALNGASSGVVTLDGTELNVTNVSSFLGQITGSGSIVKNTPGTLTLGGATSDYSGGTTISAGAVQFNSASAAGTGTILVQGGGTLVLGAGVTAPMVLAGGTLGVAAAVTTPANLAIANDSIVTTFNAVTGATSNDLILTGMLQGSGNITLLSINGNNPDSQAFRLRGPASDYSGTITVNQSAKFELQTSVPVGSPMGTGTLILTGGNLTTTQAGTYSLVNVRNNSGAGVISDANYGNNIQIQGLGTAFFNMLGSAAAGSSSIFGDLLIGDGQGVGAGATDSAPMTLAFPTVHLNGGNATFIPQPIGNTGFDMVQHIRLGTITENVPGSGIVMNGAASLTLTGLNTYTGPTDLRSGTTILSTGSSIASSSFVNIEAGAVLDATALEVFTVPFTQILTVNGSLSGTIILEGAVRGSGTILGPVTALSDSLISPGNSAGVLTVDKLTFDEGALLQMELAKVTPGAQPILGFDYDSVAVTNQSGSPATTVQLGGTLDLTIGGGIEQNDVFVLIVNGGADAVSGTFAGLPHGAFFDSGGMSFQISYGDDSATPGFELTGGNDVSVLAIPEPFSGILLLGGLATCAMRRTRQRA